MPLVLCPDTSCPVPVSSFPRLSLPGLAQRPSSLDNWTGPHPCCRARLSYAQVTVSLLHTSLSYQDATAPLFQ